MGKQKFNDLLTQLNLGIKQRRPFVFVPLSNKNNNFLKLLLKENLINGFFKSYYNSLKLVVFLKYWSTGPVIKKINILNNKDSFIKVNKNTDLMSKDLIILSSAQSGFYLYSNSSWNLDANKINTGGVAIAKIII